MKNALTPKRMVGLAILVLIGVATYFLWFSREAKNEMVFEKTGVVRKDIILFVSTTGRVQPMDQVDVGTEVSGTVSRIYADFNQKVKKGQVLLELDREKATSKVEQSRASYTAASIEVNYLKSVLDRTRKLVESGGATVVDLETAQYKYDAAQSGLVRASNDLKQAQIDLANCTIRSPIDGVILNREVEVGQTVAASLSAPVLFVIARDLARMQVEADVDEADIGQVHMGQNVEFSVDAHPRDAFVGKVQEVRLSPTITSNVVTYKVVIEADNSEGKLLPGMTATCNIIASEARKVLALPVKALQFEPEGAQRDGSRKHTSQVWVNDAKGRITPQKVETGLSDGVHIEIRSGLNEGDSVILGTIAKAEQEKQSTNGSPFMPKRPSKRNQGGPPPM